MSITYIYCKMNPNQVFQVFYIIQVKANYFIFVYFFMTLLQEGFKTPLVGLLVGHLYYYLKEVLPRVNGRRLLETPRIL